MWRDRAFDNLRRCGPCHDPVDPAECERPTTAIGRQWPRCPAAICREPAVQAVVATYNAKQVSPIEAWPGGWAAFITRGVCALEASQNERTRRELKENTRR